jgi:RHS repeat-associated protein
MRHLNLTLLSLFFSFVTSSQTYQDVSGEVSGYTPGNFNVTDGGAAAYGVQLIIVPGTAGLQPSLGISYSSQGGNGLMGLGWSLQGLSAITRTSQTLAQDGQVKGVSYTDEDRFNLDGERLVTIVDADPYGGDNTEYRTEQNAFYKILSLGSSPEGYPQYFKVYDKAGNILEYGNTTDSRIEVDSPNGLIPIYYLINKISDRNGNYVLFDYSEIGVTGEYYPNAIYYTGNTQTGLQPYASVTFEYEDRADSIQKYLAGASISALKRRLVGIQSSMNNEVVRSYTFAYQYSASSISELVSIQECGINNECHDPTNFVWSNSQVPSFNTFGYNQITANSSADKVSSMDMNGDGVMDIVKVPATGSVEVYLSDKDVNNLNFDPKTLNPSIAGGDKIVFADYNGDGLIDIFKYNNSNGSNSIYFNTSTIGGSQISFSLSNNIITSSLLDDDKIVFCLDFNSDGRSDFLTFDAQNGNNNWMFSQCVGNNPIFTQNGNSSYFTNLLPTSFFNQGQFTPVIADFTGDGLIDFFFYKSFGDNLGQNSLYKSSNGLAIGGAPSFSLVADGIIPSSILSSPNVTVNTPDFNADGLPDVQVYYKTTGSNTWYRNTGNNVFQPVPSFPANLDTRISGGDYLLNLDINSDGYSDMVWINKTDGENRWFLNDGRLNFTELTNSLLPTASVEGYDLVGYGNFSSKTIYDFCFSNFNSSPKLKVFKGNTGYNNLISEIQQGNGVDISVEYDLLTNTDLYEKGTEGIYPLIDFQATQYAVKKYGASDGIGGTRYMSYHYKGAKLHVNGRGFRGFSEVRMTDELTGIIQTKYFESGSNSWKYISSPQIASITALPNTIEVSETEITNGLKTYYGGKVHYSFISKNVSTTRELDGTLMDVSSTRYEYDDFGNPTLIVNDYGGGLVDSLINVYQNDPTNWLVGKLLDSHLYRLSPGHLTEVKSSHFVYDMSGLNPTGRLLTEVSEPDSSMQIKITKTYTYDSYGNILTSSTTTWNGYALETRTNTTTYDALGRFVLTSMNALGHTTIKTYDQNFGHVLTETNPNGLVISYTYDAFGRSTLTEYPDGNWQSSDYRKCGGAFNCPPYAFHLVYHQSATTGPVIQYYDIQNREIRSESIGFDGTHILQDTYFNDRGLTWKKTNPYYEGQTQVYTTLDYDDIGRVVQKTLPGDRIETTTYDGYTTINSNALNQVKIIIKDAKERVVVSRDNENNDVYYSYDASGDLISIRDFLGNEITMSYDVHGFKTSMSDPDMGTYLYQTNRFGELVSQTYPSGANVSMHYDLLGRLTQRTEIEGTSMWVYDNAPNGIGALISLSSFNGYTESYEFDELSRVVSETKTIEGTTYTQGYAYDEFSRLIQTTYPTNFSTTNQYNQYGYFEQITNAQTNESIWTLNAVDARSHITEQQYGNGINVSKHFDTNTNFLESITAEKNNIFLQKNYYEFDAIGDLLSREDSIILKREEFLYDGLNRLIQARVLGGDSLQMEYDAIGNIIFKSDVGIYTYGEINNGPHRVVAIDGSQQECLPAASIETSYYSFNKVHEVSRDSLSMQVFYNSALQRNVQKLYTNGTLTRTKHYVSSMFEREFANGITTNTHYVNSPEGVVLIYTTRSDNSNSTEYIHRDHIGSVALISDQNATVIAQFSFDAWGMRRNSDWSNELSDTTYLAANRGFTGHEHYDLFELIDMNGRIYDPILGRFSSPDAFIQEALNLQSLNRYSYVGNNPLSYTDPSGWLKVFGAKIEISNPLEAILNVASMGTYQLLKQTSIGNAAINWSKENWKTLAVIAVGVAVGSLVPGLGAAWYLQLASSVLSGAASGFASGAAATLLAGGNVGDAMRAGLKGAAISGVSAGLTFGVGELAGKVGTYGENFNVEGISIKIVGHSLVQGSAAVANGGKFFHGAISGALGSASGMLTSSMDSKALKLATASIVGGTASKLTGGDVATGALSSSFVIMYNDSYNHDPNREDDRADKIFKDTGTSLAKTPFRLMKGALVGAAVGSGLVLAGLVSAPLLVGAGVGAFVGGIAANAYSAYTIGVNNTNSTLETIVPNSIGQ